jgi:hypothetical protein
MARNQFAEREEREEDHPVALALLRKTRRYAARRFCLTWDAVKLQEKDSDPKQ